jgi:hypothetical protein
MFFTISILVLLGSYVELKPVDISNIDVSSDPIKGLKNYYAGIIWKEFDKKKTFTDKFKVVVRALEYDPELKSAYKEICASYSDYINNKVSVRELVRILREATERFGGTEYLECYTGSMVLLGRYSDAISFLEKEMEQALESQKNMYQTKILSLKNEKNILYLTKAMEAYFQKTKKYPGDILVLVAEGYIDQVPDDPYGGQYFIGEQGQIMSTSARRSNP